MRKYVRLGILIAILLMPSLVSSDAGVENTVSAVETPITSALVAHDPIIITHDDNFTQQGFEGLGTRESPYLIESLYITEDIDILSIKISNTREHFQILNCYLQWQISLSNVTNGRISGCTVSTETYYTIGLHDTENTTIGNNWLEGNVGIGDSDNITIVNNTFNSSSLEFSHSSGNLIENNTIIKGHVSPHRGVGLKIYHSPNNTLLNNSFYECGMYLYVDWNNADIKQTIVENNTVNDKPLVFYQDTNEIAISYAGQIIITNCSNILIEDASIDHTMHAMNLMHCENITIRNCLVQNTYEEGILIGSSNNTFIHDTQVFSSAYTGIGVSSCNTTITNVHIWNASTALHIWSDNANVTESIFQDDRSPYYDLRTDADNIYFHRNYYSNYSGLDLNNDGFGDTNYTIYGTAKANDTRPYMYPPIAPEWESTPTDCIVAQGVETEFEIPIISDAPVTTWSVNDTLVADFDHNILTVFSSIELGEYGLNLYAENIYGMGISAQLTVIVQDRTLTWVEELEDLIIEVGEKFSLQLQVADPSDIDRYEVVSNSFQIDEEGLLTNATTLDYGTIDVEINVYDIYDNCLSDSFKVTIDDTQIPIIITSPDDITYTVGSTGNAPLWSASDHTPDEWRIFRKVVIIPGLSPMWYSGIDDYGPWAGQNITIDVDDLEVGIHEYKMVFTDQAGNSVEDEMTVTVIEDTTTSTDTTPTSTTTPTTTGDGGITDPTSEGITLFLPFASLVMIAVGGIGAISLLIIVHLLRQRRIGGQ